MPRKPALTNESFIKAIFQPSKNPLPKGIRKSTLKRVPGRNARRVRAYNKLAPAKQELLKRTNQRESYLRGETTLSDARNQLRVEGIRAGWARPVRSKSNTSHQSITGTIEERIFNHFVRLGDPSSADFLRARIHAMTPTQKREALSLSWNEITSRASNTDNIVRVSRDEYEQYDYSGDEINPYWYNN